MATKVTDLKTRGACARAIADLGYSFRKILSSPEANPKVYKNTLQGVFTAPLHLAPAKLSGYEVCPQRTEGCTRACLHTAGNPLYQSSKNTSRIHKTKAYMENRPLFMNLLILEIEAHYKASQFMDMACGLRLNATSDIPWERVSFTYKCQPYANLMEMFPQIQFYDYTKRSNRKNLPGNYHLTFSLAEDNMNQAIAAANNGMNVAVVMNVGRTKPLPKRFSLRNTRREIDLPVYDGDVHDYRPSDPPGHIIGLRAKGLARGDTSGFVQDVSLQV